MIQAIDRAARVLASLQGARHLGISDLAAELGLPPSTVHGIVSSLAAHGLVAKEQRGSRYMLGPTLLRLSNVYLDTLDVRARSMRWTAELARRTGFAVRLGAPYFDEVIIVHHNSRPDGTEQMPETGLAIPAHASALGKVLLAFNPAAAEELLAKPLRALTADTVVNAATLRAELAATAARGYGVEAGEAVIGEGALAAPIVDQSGAVIAAVSVVVPTSALPASEGLLAVLREAARNISKELGARSWPPAAPSQ